MSRKRIRRWVDYLAATTIDLWRWLTGKTDRHLPPLRLRFVGAGDFRKTGEELARLLIETGGLKPDDRVLDIGCGIGRVSIPLTRFLSPSATYDGFDVVKRGILWCSRHLTPAHPNFRFHHVEVANSEYAPRGAPAAGFRFPFADAAFDFAFATSLFTHLVTEEMRRYAEESARVLRPGGRFLATFFLLNDQSRAVLPMRNIYNFPHVRGDMRLLDAGNPAAGVAIEEAVAVEFLRNAGFSIEQIAYGEWSGRRDFLSFQDVVVCRRSSPAS